MPTVWRCIGPGSQDRYTVISRGVGVGVWGHRSIRTTHGRDHCWGNQPRHSYRSHVNRLTCGRLVGDPNDTHIFVCLFDF